MKKIVGLVLAVIMVFSVTGCTDKDDGGDFAKITAFKSEETERTEKTTTRKKKVTTTKKEVKKPPVDTHVEGGDDIKNAIELDSVPDNGIVSTGKFIKVDMYTNLEDGAINAETSPVYLRVNKVTSRNNNKKYVDDAIALHNKYAYVDSIKIDAANLDAETENVFCVLDYDVYVPKDFKCKNNELLLFPFDFNTTNQNETGGMNIGICMELMTRELGKVSPGALYNCRSYFTVNKDCKNVDISIMVTSGGGYQSSKGIMKNIRFKAKL